MGSQQPKKGYKANKGQIDVACLKAKIHLELVRDRKHNDIIKGQKQLVAKIKGKSRNKVQEILIAERVVNGLKYAQACNLLISCAATLRGHALFLAENQDKPDKINPWLPFIYSLIYGADNLGLSSLNQFKSVLRALNDPIAVPQYTNPEIIQLLTPSPTPEELNMYMVEMSQRNAIPLEEINIIGHKFTKDFHQPIPHNETMEEIHKDIAQKFKEQFQNGFGNHTNFGQGGQGFNGGNQGFNGGNQGFNGGNHGNQGSGGYQGYGQNHQINPYEVPPNNLNPYLSGKSEVKKPINIGPQFHEPEIHQSKNQINKPRQFSSYQDIIGLKQDPNIHPLYPSIDPNKFNIPAYKAPDLNKKQIVDNPFSRNSVVNVNNKMEPTKTPTLSQILRDL